jgi:hypothetical protein
VIERKEEGADTERIERERKINIKEGDIIKTLK